MATPAVSVVIPTYNRVKLLTGAIESVLNQTFPDFELIVVDDHSPTSPGPVVARFGDPRIRLIRNARNLGLPDTRNVGLAAARADLVACLDDDDRWLPQKLQLQLEVFRRSTDPRLAAVYGGVQYEYPDGTVEYLRPRHRGDLLDPLLQEPYVVKGGFSCLLLRRQAVLEVGGFDSTLRMREDYELQLRLALAGCTFDFVDAPILRYRADGPDSLSRKGHRRARGILQVYRKHRPHFRRSKKGRHFVDLMHASRFMVRSGHPSLAWKIYRHAVQCSRPPQVRWRYMREYLAVPAKIGAARMRGASRPVLG